MTDLPALASFLLDNISWLRHHQDGPQVVDDVIRAVDAVKRAIDKPPERVYVGRCGAPKLDEDGREVDCQAEVYARPGAPLAVCGGPDGCGASWDVEERRAWLLEAARDQLENASTIARAVTALGGQEVTPERIWKWKERGRIVPHGYEDAKRKRPLYRVGDVLDLLTSDARAEAAKGQKRRKAS